MNKTDLVEVVALKTELSKKDSEKAVKAVFDGLTALRTPEQVAALRGKTVEEILG